MHRFFQKLTAAEHAVFAKLNTPAKIQDFLDRLKVNFEKGGDTLRSPRNVLRFKKAHCLEGALFAAAALLYHGKSAVILDLQPRLESSDDGHAVALFRIDGYWGALSKTNHAVLRYRDAIYKTPRELVLSYFHEYFLDDGVKNLRSYTILDLKKIKKNWITDEKNVWYIDEALNKSIYKKLLTKKQEKMLRRASNVEIQAGKLVMEKK